MGLTRIILNHSINKIINQALSDEIINKKEVILQ